MIIVRYIPLPHTIYGVTLPDYNGDFNVYINSKLPDQKQKEAVEHEIKHIELDHFYSDEPVRLNELEAG